MTPQELLTDMFAMADMAHTAHLATRSYAQHMALGEFYEGVREQTDAIVESMIGLGHTAPTVTGGPILKQIADKYEYLANNREACCQGLTELENLYDELLAVYVRAIYKLKRFT